MLSCLLFVLTVTSLSLSHTVDREASLLEDICNTNCTCKERQNILVINCENKGFTTFRQFHAPPDKISQLSLNGNILSRIGINEFINYCNVTSLYLGKSSLQEIRPGAFLSLSFLKQLHLNNNNLEVIQEDTLAGLKSLEYLRMDYNYISSIDPEAFGKLTKLKVLILNDNLLSILPPNIFCFMPLIHLDLRGNRLKMLPLAGVLEDLRSVMEIKLQGNPWDCTCDLILLKYWLDTTSLSVGDIVCETPSNLHGKDITQLLEQDLCPRRNAGEPILPPSDSHFQGALHPTDHPAVIIPTHTHQVYQTPSPVPMLCPSVCSCTSQNLDSGLNIDCRGRKLQNISELTDLAEFSSLEVLDLGDNRITVIQEGAFENLTNLKKLYLNGNYLRMIYRLDLAEFSSLEVLHLGDNRITVIQEGAFENLTNLKKLYLNGNYLRMIYRLDLAEFRSLKVLHLGDNRITVIQEGAFENLTNLKRLYLNRNYIRMIYRLDLAKFNSLEVLHLGNNRITVIQEGAFENLTNLKILYLNGNNIESLSQFLFAGLHSLRYLYLQYNFIKDMSPHTFSALHDLQQIVLNNNLLHSLPDNVFSDTVLARLNLRSNRFSHLPFQGVLDQLSAFINIDLQGNPWDCTCPILALKDWMELPSMVASEITCNSPSQHAGRLLRLLSNEAICPEPSKVPPPQKPPPTKTLTSVSTTTPPPQNTPPTKTLTSVSTATPVYTPKPRPKELFSALMLSLVIIFILSVCVIPAVFKLVLKRCRRAEHVPTGVSNLDPANPNPTSVQVQNDSDIPEPRQDTSSESHVCNDPPPPCSMSQNPVYMQKDGEQAPYHPNPKEFSFGPRDARKQDVLTCSQGASTITTKALIEKYPPSCGLTPLEPPETLYETMGERPNQELPEAAGAPPAPLLPRKQKAEPYHQEVLENQTVMTLV